MAQDTRTSPAVSIADSPLPQPRTETSPGESSILRSSSFSADHYADSLMDELFEDVNRILDGVVPADAVHPETDTGSELAVRSQPPSLTTDSEDPLSLTEPSTQLAIAPDLNLAIPDAEPPLPTDFPEPEVDKSQQRLGVFDQLLLLAAGISVVATVVLGFMLERTWRQSQTVAPTLTAAQIEELERRQAFLDYMQDSLEAIDRRVSQAQVPNEPGQPPGAPGAGNPANSPTVLERVYIPVYQAPQIAGVPPIAPAAPNQQPNVPAPPAAASPSAPVASAPAVAYTLVGILELGDRSAALVNINGTTQRFQVGETIGASGWTLVSVENQEAIIRRNGEVRSIYVGQVF